MLDMTLGRFFTQDRYADIYHSFSPYQYTANNPVNFVDENGDYIVIDRKDEEGKVMLSLLYENGKAYYYSKDKDGNIVKGDAWDGKDNFITQAVTDLKDISSTKEGKTVVGDLQDSKYSYNISEASQLVNSGFEGKDGTKGGGSISYYQKGGSHVNATINKSAVVLGHELFHAWSFEFTSTTKKMDYGARLLRETMAVEFENYLRAGFGETEMRTHYRLQGNNTKVASSSAEDAKNYKLPNANYLMRSYLEEPRSLPRADNTAVKTYRPYIIIDTRKGKF